MVVLVKCRASDQNKRLEENYAPGWLCG
ncbi:hypothetical protein ANHS_468 [Ligilactobacillus ruminis ATCC 25644]|nr:hypothetical protein ANHS_468 [Ligilactobacillus ruminis ATCC 25644]